MYEELLVIQVGCQVRKVHGNIFPACCTEFRYPTCILVTIEELTSW